MALSMAFSCIVCILASAPVPGSAVLPSASLKWGADDELGATNLITSDSVLAAAQYIRRGKTYHLGMIMDRNTPSFGSRSLQFTLLHQDQGNGFGENRATFNDDLLFAWLGTGSQIDGLGHACVGDMMYNGFNRSIIATDEGLTKLGLEKLPPFVGRGVLLDMAAFFGKEMLSEGTAYTQEDVVGAAARQGVHIRKGDVVLFHSGWLALASGTAEERQRYISGEPGLGTSAAEYLVQKGVMAVGSDTWGTEVWPPQQAGTFFRVHQILMTLNGIFNFENMNTAQLVEDETWEFMFVLGPTRIRGASQMMINPIAIA